MRWKTKQVSLFLLLTILLDYACGGTELLPMAFGSGSASGSDIMMPVALDPPSCNTTSLSVDVNVFDTIIDSFLKLNCRAVEEGYAIVFKSSELGLDLMESDNTAVFVDYFDHSNDPQTFYLEVCNYDILNGDVGSCVVIIVTAVISRHSDRLLPFGGSFSDESVTNADDRSVGIFLSNPIPFWSGYYNSVYLSTNGVLSFGRPFTQYWPVTFPYGWSTVPVIAPYWNDLDFRNYVASSGLYYHTYTKSGTKRDEAFLQEFSDRLDTYTGGDPGGFEPNWMIIATWYKATPYYGRYNRDETLTFQLLMASDSVDTYAIFLYKEDGINWNRANRRIVIGYDAKNYVDYLNVDDSEDFTEVDSLIGNTGNIGEWYFHLTDSDYSDINYEQECFKWVARQEEDVFEKFFEGLPSCPCTQQQAWRDWRFWFGWRWGLSSGPNCATLIWSRRQSTIECCYDDSGALQVGGKSGGSYRLHHPWFSNRKYITEDQQPYEHCCQFSKLCPIFYTYRPSDDCSGYDPSRISFMWGDPHFQTVDGVRYTFNGLGEYVLLRSRDKDLDVQVRLTLLDVSTTDFNATVISAVVVRQGTAQPVQVEGSAEGMTVYLNGSAISLPTEDDSNLILTENTTYDSFNEFAMSEQNFSTTDYISLRYNNDDVIITTSSGATVMVSNSSSVLHLAVEVSNTFIDSTEGLLGYFNGDSSDDFFTPNGDIVSNNSTERDLFGYGQLWHVNETDSHFEYIGNDYSFYNDGWDTHIPTFRDELTAPSIVQGICGSDLQCIFDYAVTNDVSFAAATHTVTISNQETQDILFNHAPDIIGPMEVYVSTGQIFNESYSVYDRDGHNISTFELKDPQPENITLELDADGVMAWLVWDDPGSELPSSAIQILVNDSMGATTVRNVSLILCACDNNGTCINATIPQYNSDGHYLQECDCPEYFSGGLCETDERSCSESSCQESSMCELNSSVPAGYTCSACQEGYELADDGKCTDINECNTTNIQYTHNCTHNCSNTEGSYECQCIDGYELGEDSRTCTDIDECYEGTDTCDNKQMCNNTEGSFQCYCYSPEIIVGDGCHAGLCTPSACDGLSTCIISGTGLGVCVCIDFGTFCEGDCSGDLQTLTNGTQSCNVCRTNMYGYRCKKVCDCRNNGTCDPVDGCTCSEGYSGTHCETEINEAAPEFAEDTVKELTLSWNLPGGAVLVEFNATDSDVGPPGDITFSLSHEKQLPMNFSSGKNVFSINSKTGVLVLEEDLNTTRGLYIRFILTVVATDSGKNPLSSKVIVAILLEDTPAPIPSFNEDTYMIEVSENTLGNSTVLNLTCSEPKDATGTSNLTTALTKSKHSSLFSLNGNYDGLMLVLLEQIDYEALANTTVPQYTLEVTCINQYEFMTSSSIEIEIINENDNAFVFDKSTYNVSIPENVPRYYEVLTVSAFDPDVPDGDILYEATNPGIFSIFPNGTVYVTNPLINREEMDEYTLNLEAELILSKEITMASVNISITDINEGPPLFDNELYISDNLTTANILGDVALMVTAEDEDFEKNGSVVYSLEENTLFAINSNTGEIYINNPNIVSLYGSYVLRVFATDEGDPPLNSTSRVDIYVAPIPDRIVFRNFSSSLSISEDSPRGYEIVTVLAEVIDQNNGVIVDAQTVGDVEYRLVDAENFHIGRFTGNLILFNSLDFEMIFSRVYKLNITASIPQYNASIIAYAPLLLSVTDVNDNAPVFTSTFYTEVVEEFTANGTFILTVHADDSDSGVNSDITYKLAGNDLPFSIDSATGRVEVNDLLNTPLDYRFFVVAEDGGISPRSSEAVVFISVIRSASVVPQFDRQRYIFNVSENTPTEIGYVLAQVGSININEYAHLRYKLQPPDTGMDVTTLFHIDSDSGAISVLVALDAEVQNLYVLYVEVYNASDDTHVFDNATIVVHVKDLNDHAPEFEQSLYTDVITTALPEGSNLFQVSAEDRDVSDSQITYSLVSDTIGYGIDSDTGCISTVNSTLFVGDYHIMVLATDGGDRSQTGTALVFIAVIPAGPQDILFEVSEYIFAVSEDAYPETLVGTIVAQDHNRMDFDSGSDLRYYFSRDSVIDTVSLSIGEFNGEVRVSSTLDRERESHYTLVVFAEYRGNQTGEVRMKVNILDVNDNRPIFTKDVYAVVVFTTHGNSSAVLNVSANDNDVGLNGEVHYSFSNGTTENNIFRIVDTSGDIYSLKEVIPAGDHQLTITASDSNPTMPQTSTAVVFICVIHERPNGAVQIVTTSFYIDENSPTGTVIGTILLQAGGMDIVPEHYEGNLEFSIGGNSFVINHNNGTLKVVGVLDREEQSFHVVEVVAEFRDYNIFTSSRITIHVGDLNDNNPIFSPSTYSTIIDDGYVYNQTVPTGELFATDRDDGTNAELKFVDLNETDPFGVRPIEISVGELLGEIFIRNASLLEPEETYLFTILAVDKGNPPLSSTAAVHIVVRHVVPDTISFLYSEYTFNYTEHSEIGTRIGTVSVEQKTPALDDLVYSVSGGLGVYKFHVNQTSGEIFNLVSLDREENTEFSLDITARLPNEPDLLPATTSVMITILDINDNIPIFDRSSYSTAVFTDDIMTGTPLINVSVSDADAGLNSLITYSISPNEFFRISENGNIFPLFNALSVETYTISVEARDMGEESLTGTAIVIIDIRNTIPESILFSQRQYLFTISEYSTAGTVVGQVELNPPLPRDFVQYRRFRSDSSDFVVVTQSGFVQSLRQFDREAFGSGEATIEFAVTCFLDLPHENPATTLTDTASIRVDIQDENDNTPQFENFPSSLQHRENVTQEEMVAHISATDGDTGTNADLIFEVLNNPSEELFRIDSMTGELFVEPGLDREEQEVYIISVLVKDQGSPQRSFQSDITLTLQDVNDNVPVLLTSEFSVEERVTGNVFQLKYKDSDTGDNAIATFSNIISDSDTRFLINSASGDVTLTEGLDYEVEQTVNLVVELRDNPNNPSNSNSPQYTVTVNVIDKPDSVPTFEQTDGYSVSINPTITTDDILFTVHATDDDGDAIMYTIVDGSTGASFVDINTDTGQLYFTETHNLETESVYQIVVRATDDSEYNLSSDTTITVTVNALSLKFEKESYTGVVSEDAPKDFSIQKARIEELSRSGDLSFTYEILFPPGADDPFMPRTYDYRIDILVDVGLDRETVPTYLLALTASRPSSTVPGQMETVTVHLNITVEDVNDNDPVIMSPDPSYSIPEDASVNTQVAQVIATDSDLGVNKELVYSITDPIGSPFKINENGVIMVKQLSLDFESQDSYSLTVQVEDLGNPARSSTARFYIEILNVNDKTPGFAALAYFGELYSRAPANSDIHHVLLEVTDGDGETEFSFSISSHPTDASTTDYQLSVSNQAPYHVIAEIIPDNAESGLRTFNIKVSDGVYTNVSILYVGVFTQEHLLTITLSGISMEEFLASVTHFLEILSTRFTEILRQSVSYYFDSVEESEVDTTRLIVTIYGWYGGYGPRNDNGKEQTDKLSNSVIYITYKNIEKESLDSVAAVLANSLGIDVAIGDVPETSAPPVTSQPENNTVLVGIVSGAVVSGLLILLSIVIIYVAGRRRKPKEEKDPYDRHRRRGKRLESIPLTPKAGSSDLAYETMYDDDDMLNQPQTMPWFDPNYLAPNETEEYDGDTELTSSRRGAHALRATVDGDAKRNRRHSSDESAGGGSVTELDTSHYLRSYQQSTPMQPGQKMGEFDMFVNDNARDSDRPHRPSLQNMTGLSRGQQRGATT